MKKILLMTICFLGIGVVVMAQERKTSKPATTAAAKKSKAKSQEAKYARLTALKKERAAAQQNQQPAQGSQPEQSIPQKTAAPAERSKQ